MTFKSVSIPKMTVNIFSRQHLSLTSMWTEKDLRVRRLELLLRCLFDKMSDIFLFWVTSPLVNNQQKWNFFFDGIFYYFISKIFKVRLFSHFNKKSFSTEISLKCLWTFSTADLNSFSTEISFKCLLLTSWPKLADLGLDFMSQDVLLRHLNDVSKIPHEEFTNIYLQT